MSIKKRGVISALPYRKSQAAIFIIMALVIIIVGVYYFFYQRASVEKDVEVVQPELVPLKLYVESCLKNVLEDGLDRIGQSGGYTDVPEKISTDPRAYLTTVPGAGFKIPYWWHDGIDSIPTEDFINQQLKKHVQAEIKGCINSFEPFAEKFEVNPIKEPSASVSFNENDVSVSLDYPLEIIGKNFGFRALIGDFSYTSSVRLKKVYRLAKLIMERENKDYFLERKTIDLYSMDPEIPTTDIEAACSTKLWQLSDIKEKLKTLLRVNLPYIRINGTSYNQNLYVPTPDGKNTYSQSYFQRHYIWQLEQNPSKEYRNMKVAFFYDDWPMGIYARPSENGILKSNSQKGSQALSFFCLHVWHFTYDINYPVLVSVIDPETAQNRAYRFNFPFRVSVDHNNPKRDITSAYLFETEPALASDEYCNEVLNEVTIFTINNATGEDVRDVNLTFVCGRSYCGIGKTDWLSFGAAAGITKRFPYCVYGVIKGAKKGYAESSAFIQTDVDGASYVLALNPLKEFSNYRVVKHPLSAPSAEEKLGKNKKAYITIRSNETDFEAFAAYPREENFPLAVPEKDSVYEVTIYVVDGEDIIGGYAGSWKVSRAQLRDSEEVVFHVIENTPSTEDEQALFVSGLASYSKNVPAPELR